MRIVFENIGFDREWLESFETAETLTETDTMKAHYSDEVRLSKCEALLKLVEKPKTKAGKPTKQNEGE